MCSGVHKVEGLLLVAVCSSTAWGVQTSNIPVQELYVGVWGWVAAYGDNKFGRRGATTAKGTYTHMHTHVT